MSTCLPTCSSSQMTASQFAITYGQFAEWASTELKWPVSLILAQWSIESDWGRLDICSPCYNPANTGAPAGPCPNGQFSNLCDGVIVGYAYFAKNNNAMGKSGNPTYANWVANAFTSGFTVPASNNYGCLPGAGRTFSAGAQAAAVAMGSSGWAETDYTYCAAGTGISCCANPTAYAGDTLWQRMNSFFSSYHYIKANGTLPSCCPQ